MQEDLNSVSWFLCKNSLLSITWLTSGPGYLVATRGYAFPAGCAHDLDLESVLEGFCALTKLGEAFSLLELCVTTAVMFYIIRPRYIFTFLRADAQPSYEAQAHAGIHIYSKALIPEEKKRKKKVLRLDRNQRATAASMSVLSGVQNPTAWPQQVRLDIDTEIYTWLLNVLS